MTSLRSVGRWFAVLTLAALGAAHAVPPPLGPPLPKAPAQDLSVKILFSNRLKVEIGNVVTGLNEALAKRSDFRAKVSVSFREFGASRAATQRPDRPNEHYVRMPFIVSYRVDDVQKHTSVGWVSVPGHRKISQSIGLQLFCDRWHTGQGSLKLVTDIDPLYLEDSQGLAESAVDFFLNGHLTNAIDSSIRQVLRTVSIPNITADVPFACNTLGPNQFGTPDPADDLIEFNQPVKMPKIVSVAATMAVSEQVNVQLVTLKRLPAKSLRGGVLYSEVESPGLQFFANFSEKFLTLPAMREGDVISLDPKAITLSRPKGSDLLVVIANVIQNVAIGTEPTDTAFMVFDSSTNFGAGNQVLKIRKVYTMPPSPPLNKPTFNYVDAYELTVKITALQPTVHPGMTSDPGTTTPPDPGTVRFPGKTLELRKSTDPADAPAAPKNRKRLDGGTVLR